MEVKDAQSAVKAAKDYLRLILADESPSNIGLEELDRDDRDGIWSVTLGFSRPWDANAMAAYTGQPSRARTFRVLRVGPDGKVLSIRRRGE